MDPPGALLASCQQEISYLSLSQSSLLSSQDDAISDSNTLPEEYSRSCSHKLTPLAFESNVSLDTLSLFSASVSNSPMDSPNSTSSEKFSFYSEKGDITTHSCNPLEKPTETATSNLDNSLGNPDTFLDQTGHRVSNTGRDYSSGSYPYPLHLSQPDGNNTWTLSLDPSISHLISESSALESSSASEYDYDNEAVARTQCTCPSVSSTPRYDGSFLSLPPLQVGVHDITKFGATSDVSMIVSLSSSVQQTTPDKGKADLFLNDLPHDFPPSTAPDPQQPSRSKKFIKKSKNVFGRLKKLFTPKGTISEDIQAHIADPPKSDFIAANHPAPKRRFFPSYQRYKLTQFSTPSFGQSFSPEDASHADNNIDEKYTYEYHARPKTLREIKSQRRFSLPMAFVGSSSRVTPSTKLNIATSVPRSRSRAMSTYIASQDDILDFAA